MNSTTKRFDRSAFVYDAEKDIYYCPAGKVLRREGTVEKIVIAGVETDRKNYRCHECAECPLASLCRVKEDSKTGRKVGHDEFQEVRERQAERMQNESVKERYKKRQHYGETQLATTARSFLPSHFFPTICPTSSSRRAYTGCSQEKLAMIANQWLARF